MKVAFLDRDGTINKDYSDEVWAEIKTPEFYPDTFAALREIRAKRYAIIVITNQYLIGEGFITQAQYDLFTQVFLQKLSDAHIEILDIFYCPHARNSECGCCKPAPGLIKGAIEKYPGIDMGASFFAGDSDADAGISNYFNLPFFRIDYESANKRTSLLDVAKQV